MGMRASWAVLDADDFYYSARQAKVSSEYAFWRICQVGTEPASEEDWTTVTAMLHRSTGMSHGTITRHLDALHTLDRLPRLKALVESTWLLDMTHLGYIDRTIIKAPAELREDAFLWAALDDDLIECFTPSRARQLLPGKRAIVDTVSNTIRSVEAAAAPDQKPEGGETSAGPTPCEDPASLMRTLPPPEDPFSPVLDVQDLAGGEIRFELIVDQATGIRISDAVSGVASGGKISQAKAMVSLLLGNVTATVTTLLYQASDIEHAPALHPTHGILTDRAAEVLAGMVTRTIDMAGAAEAVTHAYVPTFGIRCSIIGRDWVCRWPGCNRRAARCDADHRVNHAEGGPTTAGNMIMLCRHHHNRKADEQIHYVLDPHTGDVYWLFKDGTWTVSEAVGPLTPKKKRWAQTYSQRRSRQYERAAAKAAAERFEAYQSKAANAPPARTSGSDPDPPPF